MDDSEDKMNGDRIKMKNNTSSKEKPKKRSLVERELETTLTDFLTSPVNDDGSSKSRFGRVRRIKSSSDFYDTDKAVTNILKSPEYGKSPNTKFQSTPTANKMQASNSCIQITPKKVVENKLENQIESIYNANISLSRFGSEEKNRNNQSLSPDRTHSKVYIRKDLIQSKERESPVVLIKNNFSPANISKKPNSHLNNILERSSEIYNLSSPSRTFEKHTPIKCDSKSKKLKKTFEKNISSKPVASELYISPNKTENLEKQKKSSKLKDSQEKSNLSINAEIIDDDNYLFSKPEETQELYILSSKQASSKKHHHSRTPKKSIEKNSPFSKTESTEKRDKSNLSEQSSKRRKSCSNLERSVEKNKPKAQRSEEKHNSLSNTQNGYLNMASVVKTLDFDCNTKNKKDKKEVNNTLSKSDLFEIEAKCQYQVGDLAWARIGTFPFWPCIVTREPGSDLFVKKKLFGKNKRDMIHVTFFCDNGRRSWVLDSMLRKYEGLAEFENARDQFTPEAKKKDPRLHAAFFISDKKLALWHTAIEEADVLLREPKRLRIDILYEMLGGHLPKTTPSKTPQSGKIVRTDSDVSLSESLFDSLFSEDDGKNDELGTKKNKSLDVSEVVTACLDNMAAKTGMTKIQRQSHMDIWLQKAKSKTPEKNQLNITVTVERVDKEERKSKSKERDTISSKKRKKSLPRECQIQKPYSFRKSTESQNLLSYHNEHDYSKHDYGNNDKIIETSDNLEEIVDDTRVEEAILESNQAFCAIDKVESLCGLEPVVNEKDKESNMEISEVVVDAGEYEIVNAEQVTDQSIVLEKDDIDKENVDNKGVSDVSLVEVHKDVTKDIVNEENTDKDNVSKDVSKENVDLDSINTSKKDLSKDNEVVINKDNKDMSTGVINEDSKKDDISKIYVTKENDTILFESDKIILKDVANDIPVISETDKNDSEVLDNVLKTPDLKKTDEKIFSTSIINNMSIDDDLTNCSIEQNLDNYVNDSKINIDNKDNEMSTEDVLEILDQSLDNINGGGKTKENQNAKQEKQVIMDQKMSIDIDPISSGSNEMDVECEIGDDVVVENQMLSENTDMRRETVPNHVTIIQNELKEKDVHIDNTSIDEDIISSGSNKVVLENKKEVESKISDDVEVEDQILHANSDKNRGTILERVSSNIEKVTDNKMIQKHTDATKETENIDDIGNIAKNNNHLQAVPAIILQRHDLVNDEKNFRKQTVSPITIVKDSDTKSGFKVRVIKEDSFKTENKRSFKSEAVPKRRSVRKVKTDKKEYNPTEEPEFLNYLEMRQDALLDENPELSQEEVVDYLYQSWQFETNASKIHISGRRKSKSPSPIFTEATANDSVQINDNANVEVKKSKSDSKTNKSNSRLRKSLISIDKVKKIQEKHGEVVENEIITKPSSEAVAVNDKEVIIIDDTDKKGARELTQNNSKVIESKSNKPSSRLRKLFTSADKTKKNQEKHGERKGNEVITKPLSEAVVVNDQEVIIIDDTKDKIDTHNTEAMEQTSITITEQIKADVLSKAVNITSLEDVSKPTPVLKEIDPKHEINREANVSTRRSLRLRKSQSQDKIYDDENDMNNTSTIQTTTEDQTSEIVDAKANKTKNVINDVHSNSQNESSNIRIKSDVEKCVEESGKLISCDAYSVDSLSLTSELTNGYVDRSSDKDFDPDTVSIDSLSSETSNGSERLSVINRVTSVAEKPNKVSQKILESDNESISSLDDVTLSELKQRSEKNELNRNLRPSLDNSMDSNKSNSSERRLRLVLTDCLLNAKRNNLPSIQEVSSKTNVEIEITQSKVSEVENKAVRRRSLRLSYPPPEVKENGFHERENASPDSKELAQVKEVVDLDTVSIKSSSSETSVKRRDKKSEYKPMQEPEFLKYLEIRQDTLIDEHPEVTPDEIAAYLYKTWQYEESLKSDIVKNEDIEGSNLVKGVNPIAVEPKKKKVVKRLLNIEKIMNSPTNKLTKSPPNKLKSPPNKLKSPTPKLTIKNEVCNTEDIKPRELPKRKASKPYYGEDFSDIEEEIKLFEIFKTQKKQNVKAETPSEIETNVKMEIQNEVKDITAPPPTIDVKSDEKSSELQEESVIELDDEIDEYYNEEEMYFEQLTVPKPNIFKGLIREKVCEICEKTSNLVKCKGCHGMFHVECVNKKEEIVETPAPTRGRKKKRGRKPKNSLDSNEESQSDEKPQDLNVSEENMSIEEAKEPEPIVIPDADDFESKLELKMKEIIDVDKLDYESYSSDDGIDWTDTVAGKCEIIDVKLKKRSQTSNGNFKCKNCQKDDTPICFVCKAPVSPRNQVERRQKCQVPHCHKYYHLECLEHWPQTQFNAGEPSRSNKKIDEHFEAMSCPRHVCHTCVCDDPRGCKTRFCGDKLARCVRCPATYHSFTKCLPAGSQILSASHIVCPRHYEHRPGKVPYHVNTGWCFICALGGNLICCDYCPTSFHADCLNIEPPEGGYMCEDCETGRLPLYGEMVWVKLGHYRWWPGIVLHPSEIPDNIMAVKHSPGEFVVRFFGQYDHYWVNRGRVFPFQEGDSGRISTQKSKIDEAFTKAMEHAQRACEILKNVEPNDEETQDIQSSLLPPHYVKLKVNKPCGSLYGKKIDIEEHSLTQCECNPDEEEPCGMDSHCLNRMLLTECGPFCRAGERCQNRAFEKRQYPKLVPYRTPHRGWGLKTLEDIKPGQFVIEYVGELIDETEFRRRMRRKHETRDENFYFLTLDKERMIDAGPKGNLARFMNHCCEPNCETQKWTVLGDVRVGLFAIKHIPANTEVTFNYNLECTGIEKKQCMCGAKRCSGYIGAKPKQDEPQPKKLKVAAKRTYKKRKNTTESPSTDKNNKPKRPVGRPRLIEKPRELTEIEKDLLIIKNATNGLSSDSECSGRLSSLDGKDAKALKRKRVSFSSEDVVLYNGISSPKVKRLKLDDEKCSEGD